MRRPTTEFGALVLAGTLALMGCYAHQGKPMNDSPNDLLGAAEAACQRHDQRAYETLLGRIVREHPDSKESEVAQRQLTDSEACLP